MVAESASEHDRPGQGPSASPSAAGADDPLDSTLPSGLIVAALDNVRAVFWQAYRPLFPPHSLAAQTRSGNLVISWSVADDPHAHHPYATPVMLRFEAGLLRAMLEADAHTRIRIALTHEPTLREGLRGYDPFGRFPNARVINIG